MNLTAHFFPKSAYKLHFMPSREKVMCAKTGRRHFHSAYQVITLNWPLEWVSSRSSCEGGTQGTAGSRCEAAEGRGVPAARGAVGRKEPICTVTYYLGAQANCILPSVSCLASFMHLVGIISMCRFISVLWKKSLLVFFLSICKFSFFYGRKRSSFPKLETEVGN